MSYQIIDMTNDPRSRQFAYFRQMLFPFAGVTAEVDITDFAARRQGRPFFLSLLYAVTRAANAVPQLRRRILPDGSVAEYDWCPPSYTAMKPDGVYVYCSVEERLPYAEFVALGRRRQREVLQRGTLTEDGDPLSFSSYPACPGYTIPSWSTLPSAQTTPTPASAGARPSPQAGAPLCRCPCM